MPPPLPARYRLEMRLGRDQDVEEWLATDLTLDRPVLVRVVGPEAEPYRQERFLGKVRSAARVGHIHLAEVYGAESAEGSAYSITEWTGGITLANRIAAGETPSIPEFLSNAAGLADGLAALHEQGIVHGAIDAAAVGYAGGHPAKLGSFGRSSLTWSASSDVQALGAALETALTGRPAGELAPSQVIDDLPPSVDEALRQAQQGRINAPRLAELIRSIPYAPPRRTEAPRSWRWLIPALVLAAAAALFLYLGSLLQPETGPTVLPETVAPLWEPPAIGAESPSAAPESPPATAPVPAASPSPPVPTQAAPVEMRQALIYDPLGDGSENSSRVGALVDDDPATSWRTERYYDPLPLLKDGVGVAFEVTGAPKRMELVGMSEGTTFQILWSPRLAENPRQWEQIAGGRSFPEDAVIQLPSRPDGVWLLWLIDLPVTEQGYQAQLAEVRFRS